MVLYLLSNNSQMEFLSYQAYIKHNPFKKIFHHYIIDIK